MFSKTITLTSPSNRIQLVPPSPAHDESVARLRSHPETLRYIGFFPDSTSIEEARATREKRALEENTMNFSVMLCDIDTQTADKDRKEPVFVGSSRVFNVDEDNRSCSLGILISPEYHRGGIATEVLYTVMAYVFDDPNVSMHRVAFETAVDNVRMRGWFETFGVKHEFTWREAWAAREGKWTDVVGYSILEGEWRDTVKGKLLERIGRFSRVQ